MSEQRPWCCLEPKCKPLLNLRDGDYKDISISEPGHSWTCWGEMEQPLEFTYDGVRHINDLNCCHYTPLKGVIRWQENVADWEVLATYYSWAAKKTRATEHSEAREEEE